MWQKVRKSLLHLTSSMTYTSPFDDSMVSYFCCVLHRIFWPWIFSCGKENQTRTIRMLSAHCTYWGHVCIISAYLVGGILDFFFEIWYKKVSITTHACAVFIATLMTSMGVTNFQKYDKIAGIADYAPLDCVFPSGYCVIFRYFAKYIYSS